jgi:hypothetical protein
VQNVFLLCTLIIPTLSFLLVNHGWIPLTESLETTDNVVALLDDQASTGLKTASKLVSLRTRVDRLILNVQGYCPNNALNDALTDSMTEIDEYVDEYGVGLALGLQKVLQTTALLESAIDNAVSYDWIIKGCLIALNVLNAFLFVGVLLTRNSLHIKPVQTVLSHVFVPLFCLGIVAAVAATCISSALAMVNADFCAGGDEPSAKGTLFEILEEAGYSDSNDLVYDAFEYYTNVRETTHFYHTP